MLVGSEVLNFNLTSVLIEQYKETQSKWTEEYYKVNESAEHVSKRRSPFVPFAIRNHTGQKISFATLTTCPNKTNLSESVDNDPGHRVLGEWKTVLAGCQLPFLIEERDKIRHKVNTVIKTEEMFLIILKI